MIADLKNKKVFISYSHDSEEHKEWVLGLAEFIHGDEIDVVFDQWDLHLGADLPVFMEKGITENDFVVCVCTENYTNKSNRGDGGVGYEKTIATARIFQDSSHRELFIPVIRNNNLTQKLPKFFGTPLYVDLSDGKDQQAEMKKLLIKYVGLNHKKRVLDYKRTIWQEIVVLQPQAINRILGS